MAIKNLECPIFHYDDPINGGPAVGWLVNVYAAGTTDRISIYSDSSLGIEISNPTALDQYGNAKIWFDTTAKIVVTQPDGTTTGGFTEDNISPSGGTSTVSGDYNLVQNGSFEAADTDDEPSQWTVTINDPTCSITVDTTNVSHGKSSVKFDGQTSYGGGNIVSQKFDVTASGTLYITLDTMASNATTTNDAQIFWYQKDDTASSTPSTTLGLPAEGSYPTSMTAYDFIVSVHSDATRAEVKLIGIDSGGSNLDSDCYFDNLVVRELYLPNDTVYVETGTFDTTSATTADDVTITHGLGTDDVEISISYDGTANMGYALARTVGGYVYDYAQSPSFTGALALPTSPSSGDVVVRFNSNSGGAWLGNYEVVVRVRGY
jgi:hypothetical protein